VIAGSMPVPSSLAAARPLPETSLGRHAPPMVFRGLRNEPSSRAAAVRQGANSPRYVGFAAAVIAVVALVWIRWSGVGGGIWADLEVYVRGGQTIVKGGRSTRGTLASCRSPTRHSRQWFSRRCTF
jgi:hypothetical protein